VLSGYRGASSAVGSILIGADRPIAVTSRSYITSPAGGTIGQTVPPALNFIDNTFGTTNNDTAVAFLPGLRNNAQFRTNLGFVAGNGGSTIMTVQFTIRNANGTAVGTRAFGIAPGGFTQLQFPIASAAPVTLDIASADVRITQGSGSVVPYASVVDNISGDAVYIQGQFPQNVQSAGKTALTNAFRDLFNRVAR
jgi:hypothetical protein